jgi:hypothetical protein
MKREISPRGQIWKFDDAGQFIGADLEPQPAPVIELAKRAYDHYMQLELEPGRTTVDIHVYALPASRRGHAADFRRHLASLLVYGRDGDQPYWRGSEYIHKLNDIRILAEARLPACGFRFVEVRP